MTTMTVLEEVDCVPFVKWIGGKRSVINHLKENLPSFNSYHEPFVGGGALFFAEGYRHTGCISDVNPELINAYSVVKDNPADLISELGVHSKKNEESYYYKVRASKPRSKVRRAARLIYLLRTCFNGLYRENSKGGFNASWGFYKNPNITQEDNIMACSAALRDTEVCHQPCWDINPDSGDFVYFDPPYYDSYTQYNANQFNEADQVRLRDMAVRLHEGGVSVMLSNSDNEFVRNLYSGSMFTLRQVYAKRTVSRKSSSRGPEAELLITTY